MRDHRTGLLGLMWGNLLLVRWEDLWPLFAAWLVPLAFAVFFAKEVKAVLFDREIARACGIPAAAISNAIIAFSGIAVTVNLNIVGGLMLFSLLTHPAAAAMQLARRTRDVVVLSIVLGAVSAVGELSLVYVGLAGRCQHRAGLSFLYAVAGLAWNCLWIQSLMTR